MKIVIIIVAIILILALLILGVTMLMAGHQGDVKRDEAHHTDEE